MAFLGSAMGVEKIGPAPENRRDGMIPKQMLIPGIVWMSGHADARR